MGWSWKVFPGKSARDSLLEVMERKWAREDELRELADRVREDERWMRAKERAELQPWMEQARRGLL